MTDLHDRMPVRRWSAPAILRQPVLHPDRTVYAYALRGQAVPTLPTLDRAATAVDPVGFDAAVEAEYALLDLAGLAGDRPLLVRATPAMLSGRTTLAADGVSLTLEIPGELAELDKDLARNCAKLRASGVQLALGEYEGSPAQDSLLAQVRVVKVGLHHTDADLAALVAQAHAAGATVVGEHADTHDETARALAAGVDLLQGPLFELDGDVMTRELTAGELQCLELMSLLSANPVDQAAVIGLVAADPMLSVRVLQLVNSSAFGLPREIDSVRQAVVLVGPHHIAALATSALVGATPSNMAELWSILTRALACWDVSGSDSGYTIGLLAAVAEQRHLPVESLVSRTGVSQGLSDALYFHAGPLGEALAAVVAHEADDMMGVLAAGRDPREVSAAYLAAVPEALAIASSLVVEPR